jgi:hypothetical protein
MKIYPKPKFRKEAKKYIEMTDDQKAEYWLTLYMQKKIPKIKRSDISIQEWCCSIDNDSSHTLKLFEQDAPFPQVRNALREDIRRSVLMLLTMSQAELDDIPYPTGNVSKPPPF